MSRYARKTPSSPLVAGTVLWDRFWAKVHKTDTCWLWTGATSASYGQFKHSVVNATVSVHRLAYETLVALIPPGFHCLHRCDVPTCVNPAHLFLGTQRDNMRDCSAKGRARGRFTGTVMCGNGLHVLSGANAYIRPQGWRSCRPCAKAAQARRQRKQFSDSLVAPPATLSFEAR